MNKLTKSLVCITLTLSVLAGCNSPEKEQKKEEVKVEAKVETKAENSDSKVIADKTTPTEEKQPEYVEPYVKAIEQINSGDLNMAIKYLDMTIQDFPDSKNLYQANLLETMINIGKELGYGTVTGKYVKGVQKYKDSALADSEGASLAKKTLLKLDSAHTNQKKTVNNEISFILENYSKYKDEPIYSTQLTYKSNSDGVSSDLSFFESVGYPIPSESSIDEDLNSSADGLVEAIFNEFISDSKVDYVKLFYNSALIIEDINKDESVLLLNEVIKLTENDKYNEERINAQDKIKELKKN